MFLFSFEFLSELGLVGFKVSGYTQQQVSVWFFVLRGLAQA
jgi:hypothetical protein